MKVHWFFNKVAKQFDCHPRWSGDIYEFENSVGTKDRAYKAEDVGRPFVRTNIFVPSETSQDFFLVKKTSHTDPY